MNAARDIATLLGRIMLALIFVISGTSKIGGFAATAALLAGKGLPLPEVAVALTIAAELGGSLCIIAGWKTRWGVLALLVFTVLATLLFHNFWAVPANQAMMQQTQFLKNVGMIGGLLLLFAHGPGRYALDRAQDARFF